MPLCWNNFLCSVASATDEIYYRKFLKLENRALIRCVPFQHLSRRKKLLSLGGALMRFQPACGRKRRLKNYTRSWNAVLNEPIPLSLSQLCRQNLKSGILLVYRAEFPLLEVSRKTKLSKLAGLLQRMRTTDFEKSKRNFKDKRLTEVKETRGHQKGNYARNIE